MQKLEIQILRKQHYSVNEKESAKLQAQIFPFLNEKSLPLKPLIGVHENGENKIYTLALPTPGGGTFRKLTTYGYESTSAITAREFVHLYLEASFNYFKFC